MSNSAAKERLEQLLKVIVETYIATAKPISSKQLASEHDFDVSPATLRNDMAELEEQGYIAQPHTSAGRIPTEKGYQYYIGNFLNQRPLNKKQQRELDTAAQAPTDSASSAARTIAKAISELTDEMVIMSVDGNEFFYTGMSNMLRKPEFLNERNSMLEVSDMFDDIEDVMQNARKQMSKDIEVFIGDNSPVARHCAMIVAEYNADGTQQVFGILGPMRMDYNKNIAILHYLEQLMNKHNSQ